MSIELGQRERKILEAVVRDYIRTAEPVGSRTLARRYKLDISPATIRNVMSDLEDFGLLSQPHTSAGRVPTESGLRFYVDSILEFRRLSDKDQEAIQQEISRTTHEAEQLIRNASRVLSSVAKHIGLISAPRFSSLALRQLQFVRLSDRLILVILVGESGLIQNKLIEVEEDLSQDDLDRFNRYLNETLEGLTISEIKKRIVEEMRKEKNQFDQMLTRALALSRKVFEQETVEENLYVDGQIYLLDYPEFADVDTMKSIFRAFEGKSILMSLLDKTMHASGVQIFIGSETELAEMEGCTLIASRYSHGSSPLGTLGVLGPTRLNYSRIIPVVDYTAQVLSRLLESTF
ncbi:MAG: heat-inducible transcriptional repressor HrcA [Proteobacteria bacterium]|nr:heat-inducible transcriptional repressor HrcA [Pseudomonadota bacterium]